VDGNSQDGRPLTYRWSGAVTGTNRTARLDTTSLSAGSYTGTARVSDDRGLTADCSASTTVVVPPVVETPKSQVLNTCSFTGKSNVALPARVNNECKAILDDAALRLQQQGDASLVLVGNARTPEVAKAKKAGWQEEDARRLGCAARFQREGLPGYGKGHRRGPHRSSLRQRWRSPSAYSRWFHAARPTVVRAQPSPNRNRNRAIRSPSPRRNRRRTRRRSNKT
jgi:hypothetical protein